MPWVEGEGDDDNDNTTSKSPRNNTQTRYYKFIIL